MLAPCQPLFLRRRGCPPRRRASVPASSYRNEPSRSIPAEHAPRLSLGAARALGCSVEAVPGAARDGGKDRGGRLDHWGPSVRWRAHERRSKALRTSLRSLTSWPSRVETQADKDCRLRGGFGWPCCAMRWGPSRVGRFGLRGEFGEVRALSAFFSAAVFFFLDCIFDQTSARAAGPIRARQQSWTTFLRALTPLFARKR